MKIFPLLSSGLFVVLYGLLPNSCREETHSTNVTVKARGRPLPKKEYAFDLVNKTVQTQTVNGAQYVNSNEIGYRLTYTQLSGSGGIDSIQLTLSKLRISTAVNDETHELHSTSAAQSGRPENAIFSALEGATFVITSDSNYSILHIAGLEELYARMLRLANGDQKAIDMLNTSVKQHINEAFIKTAVLAIRPGISDKKLRNRNSWQDSIPIPGLDQQKVLTSYKVKSFDSLSSVIESVTEIDLQDKEMIISGQYVKSNLEGKREEIITIVTTTGLVDESSTDFSMRGDITVMGMDMPMKIVSTASVRQLD